MNKNELKPAVVFAEFAKINQIPRPSKREEKMIQYLQDWGKSHQLDTKVDETGNVIIRKPATKGIVPSYFCFVINPIRTSNSASSKLVLSNLPSELSSSKSSSPIMAQPMSKLPSLEVDVSVFKLFSIMSLSVNSAVLPSAKVHIIFPQKVLPDCLTSSLYNDDVFCILHLTFQ